MSQFVPKLFNPVHFLFDSRLACRLVISGASIVGLVSLSDLQKLPVRAVLFALITGLEISMFEVIKKECPNDDDWKHHLSPGRRRKIDEEIGPSHPSEIFVDALLSTQFCDKADILQRITQLPESKTTIKKKMDQFYAALWTYFAPPLTYARRRASCRGSEVPKARRGVRTSK